MENVLVNFQDSELVAGYNVNIPISYPPSGG